MLWLCGLNGSEGTRKYVYKVTFCYADRIDPKYQSLQQPARVTSLLSFLLFLVGTHPPPFLRMRHKSGHDMQTVITDILRGR